MIEQRRPGRVFRSVASPVALALVALVQPGVLQAQVCGTPGKDGPGGVLAGVVNTYYPGSTANLAAGATSISIGAASGAAVSITPGDLLLIVQMQDAAINSSNTSAYGANNGTGTGSTNLNSSGRYEYVTATNSVGLAGGTVTIRGTGAGNGLVYAYTNAAASGTQGQRRYQVIRVPQYSSATLSSGLTAAYWNGTTGGILAIDVAGTLTLGGTVSVDGRGFRGGAGRGLTGGSGGANTDYRNLASNTYHGMKGEGIAGTPRYVVDPVTTLQIDIGVEGYPNGSTARGAPGTAGGGGTDGRPSANDENSGGGGGSNAGAGGRGGNSWNSNLAVGGLGGASFPAATDRLVLGGGGGAGSRNNSSGTASSGGAGGGAVLIRAGSVAGTGTITSNGVAGNTPQNDGGGGGGAGGSVLVFAQTGSLAGLSVQARGGAGGNADVGGAPHGPGGGGGGGFVVLSGAATVDVAGGAPGYTVSPGNLFGATAGSAGTTVTTLVAAQIPGAAPSAACVPVVGVTKTTSTPSVTNSPTGTTATYTVVVTNQAGRDSARTVTLTDTLPGGFTFASTSAVVLSGGASRPVTTNPAVGSGIPTWGTFVVPGGGSVSVTFVVTVPAATGAGTYQNPATVNYLNPGRTTVGGTTGVGYAPASSTGEDVTVTSSGPCVLVTTVAELRSQIANAACTTIDIASGTYLLASSGSGKLQLDRDLVIRNVGLGAVIIDGTGQAGEPVFEFSKAVTVEMIRLTIQGGTENQGGGIRNTQGGATLRLTNSTVRNNTAGDRGGGIYNKGTVVCLNSTISGNTVANNGGGGIQNDGGTLTMTNCTVSGNTSVSREGGGILNRGGGVMTLINTTVANNAAPTGGGIHHVGSSATLRNTIVADNSAPSGPQIGGNAITSNGFNLVEGGCTGCLGSDLTADPMLGALASNGGDTQTHALLTGSPAIDAARASDAPATDQRGVARPVGTGPDIGSYEWSIVYGVVVTPDGAQNLQQLPSNGSNYSVTFTVTNTGSASSTYGLRGFGRSGTAVTIVSVNGTAGDTAAVTVGAGAAQSVVVQYTLGVVASGARDTVWLRASLPAVRDSGFADLTVVRPAITVTKGVTPGGTQQPGTDLTYTVTMTNVGTRPAVNAVAVDSLATQVQFKVGTVANALPPGVSVTVAYSNDAGTSWTYTPASLGCGAPAGYDGCVNRIRWTLLNDLSASAPNNVATFQFVARIK